MCQDLPRPGPSALSLRIHYGRQVPFWDEGQFGDKTKEYNPAEDTNFPAEEDQSDLDRLVFSSSLLALRHVVFC